MMHIDATHGPGGLLNANAMDALNERMFKELLRINPESATAMGLHDPYDMHLSHGGLKRLTDSHGLVKEWHSQATRVAAGEQLSLDHELFLKALGNTVEVLRFAIEDYQLWKMYPDAVEGVGSVCFMMFARDYAPVETRARAVASRLSQVPRFLEEFRTMFVDGKHVKLWTEIAIESCDNVPGFLEFIEASWKDRVSPGTASELSEGVKRANDAIRSQKAWLEGLLKTATADFAMGPGLFEKMLKIRGLGMTGDDILQLGERYLRDLKAERLVVADRISGGKGLEEAKKAVEANAPKTFEEGLEATRAEMEKAKRFIIEHGIATVDEKALLSVVETPEFLRPMLPYAAMFMSAKFDPVQEGVYLVTRPKDVKDLGSHLNYGAIINTAVHEAYPGHFHQGVCSNQRHWMLQVHLVPLGKESMSVAAETVEGWAHYCEKMMFDHGYEANDPAALEMLNGAIWRAYRIVADIKLARGEATPEEMVELGMKEVGMPRDAGESEVKRYTYTPGQALSYLLGRHMMIEFRKEMEAELGQRFDEKRFHDLVASYSYLPEWLMEEAVRKSMA